MTDNNEVYVTYKWLFVTAISILTISLGFLYFSYGGVTKALDAKADIQWVEQRAATNSVRIDILCDTLNKLETKQDKILDEINKIKALIRS